MCCCVNVYTNVYADDEYSCVCVLFDLLVASEIAYAVGAYVQALDIFNLHHMDIISSSDMAELRPQLTRLPDSLRLTTHAPPIVSSMDTTVTTSASASADTVPVYWCFSHVGILFFLYFHMCRMGWQKIGSQAGALKRYKLILDGIEDSSSTDDDESISPEDTVSKTLMKALNRGSAAKFTEMFTRFSHIMPYMFAGGWWWPFDLNDSNAPPDGAPIRAPLKNVEQPSFQQAAGSRDITPSAAVVVHTPEAATRSANRQQNFAAYIAQTQKLYPGIRIPLPPLVDGVKYTLDEMQQNEQLLLAPDSPYWESMRVYHSNYVINVKKWLKPEQLQTGPYSAEQWQPSNLGEMVDPESNTVYKSMADFVRRGLLAMDPNQVSRVCMGHGPPGLGKTWNVQKSVHCTHRIYTPPTHYCSDASIVDHLSKSHYNVCERSCDHDIIFCQTCF